MDAIKGTQAPTIKQLDDLIALKLKTSPFKEARARKWAQKSGPVLIRQ